MSQLPSLVVFGSLSTFSSIKDLAELRHSISQDEDLHPIKEAISGLQEVWAKLSADNEAFNNLDGLAVTNDLASWALDEKQLSHNTLKSNMARLPLTILSHICDYLVFLRRSHTEHSVLLDNVARVGGVQGFCVGLLSAIAIAGSSSKEEVCLHGAAVVRLAFAIGVHIELDSLQSGRTSCLAVRWKGGSCNVETVQGVLDGYEATYVSVIRNTNELTITVPTTSVLHVCDMLGQKGVSVLDTGITGRYHSSSHLKTIGEILRNCEEYMPTNLREHASVRANSTGHLLPNNDLFTAVVEEILTRTSNWPLVLHDTTLPLSNQTDTKKPLALAIRSEAALSSLTAHMDVIGTSPSRGRFEGLAPAGQLRDYPTDAIAVIGISCKFPGADGPDEFWQLLTKGSSMVEEVPPDRWPPKISSRGGSGKGGFWGNFIRNIGAFDHRFFKKSSREAASMDPQQRLLLQGAYEAMESANYFSKSPKTRNRDIGCYLGLCAVDYDSNLASHPPNAFSTMGSLRAFLSGKISHYFGWSGPSLTFDTACSSSAVAIHTACRAIQGGECTEALAGGAALITNPYLYENLAAAHFLSPSGATKPFDAAADGYCRGEGIGLVVLKKLSKAIADGDNALSVIGGSAVNQNANCVPITVPNAPSQESLYLKAARQAGIDPHQISFVEAHGTGTPVGDPIEMDSIRKTFTGPQRQTPLYVSSVKGNIGHLEGASGVAGLIKAILQIQNRRAPIQASFKSLNPSIPPLDRDLITIPTTNIDLTDSFLTACVNNYGAAGSNSTLMLMQPPSEVRRACKPVKGSPFPIQITANSEASLRQYCQSLKNVLQQKTEKSHLLPSIAHQIARQTNQGLPLMFMTSVSDVQELEGQLTKQLSAATSSIEQRPPRASLVLVFGGQVRDYVGMDKDFWEASAIFRCHVDGCDEILRSMGHESLYPFIFQSEPIANIVTLHCLVFAVQYAAAMSWIENGLDVDAVIGHSLGQLTALVVSGVLSLQDGLKFVAGRASLMKTHWGSEKGTMILVEADLEVLSKMQHSLEVACYNGRSSHVLVGTEAAVSAFEEELANAKVRFRRLQVTNGFHSRFTDPLIEPLQDLAKSIRFNEAKIPIETCSEGSSWAAPTPDLLARHTRDPVFFYQAVERLAGSRDSMTWLEVGFDSGVTSMARRAIDASQVSKHGFVPTSLSRQPTQGTIVDATMRLWKRGHKVQYWNFHRLQRYQYNTLRLPSYQWEKTKHWLELVAAAPEPATTSDAAQPLVPEPERARLIQLVQQTAAESTFKVDPRCKEYEELVSGHVVAGSPLCPATLYMEVAARALKTIVAEQRFSDGRLGFSRLRIDSPLGIALDRDLTLKLRPTGPGNATSFDFEVTGHKTGDPSSPTLSHALGRISLQDDTASLVSEFARYERLTGVDAIDALLSDPDAECIRGSTLYKVFSRVVEYSAAYRGLKSVSAKNSRIAGTVVASPQSIKDDSLTNPPLVDSWMQIAGINANNFYPCPDDQVYVFTKLDYIQFGSDYQSPDASASWIVYSILSSGGTEGLTNDIFVFDQVSRRLVVLILGARFNNVRLGSLRKVLSRVNGSPPAKEPQPAVSKDTSLDEQSTTSRNHVTTPIGSKTVASDADDSVFIEVCQLFERVAEVPRANVQGHMTTDDLGIDSLMMMEVINELSSHFAIDLPTTDMVQLTTVDSLLAYLRRRGCGRQTSSKSSTASSRSTTPSSIESSSTPASSRASPKPQTRASEGFEKLQGLLQEHLELSALPKPSDNLADMGLDSLLAMELGSDIEKLLSTTIDLYQIDGKSTVQDLAGLAGLSVKSSNKTESQSRDDKPSQQTLKHKRKGSDAASSGEEVKLQSPVMDMPDAQAVFSRCRLDFDKLSQEEGFADFWNAVYPDQARLVLSYVATAFKKLGCDLAVAHAGDDLDAVNVLDRHKHLLARMHHILVDGGYVQMNGSTSYIRTSKEFDLESPELLLERITAKFPIHASEHLLLNVTGSRLAECLTGKVDPLGLLFAKKANRQLLADVYDLAPMCRATTRLLASYLAQVFPPNDKGEVFHLLEVGGGTGGTSRYLVEYLTRRGIPFTYTFTDVSSALVSNIKKTFGTNQCMRFATLDVEQPPPADFVNKYHAIISTNCIHATRNATSSMANLRTMLRPEGLLALVEFTSGLYWFDLVYGLLDGWWVFSDGRNHALADTPFWEQSFLTAGYTAVAWSDGDTPECRTLRLICGFNSADHTSDDEPQLSKRAGIPMETVSWKDVNKLKLEADIYYPSEHDNPTGAAVKRPIALLFHGGGHVVFTRKDIHVTHIKSLLKRGFLPISVDYRLCPEVTLAAGPMTDACDALSWARTKLPHMRLAIPEVQVDAERIVAIGWSAGGHLAMTLPFTGPPHGVRPPDAILAFYCPSNFEDDWWRNPIFPSAVHEAPDTTYELLEGIRDRPLGGYKPMTSPGAPMTLSDPRWRIIIHYNWKAQLLPILIKGLPTKGSLVESPHARAEYSSLPMPSVEEIRAVSPFAQIQAGRYKTPTFIVHGDEDDLIPWTQSRETIESLKTQGVEAGLAVPKGAPHAFDLPIWGKEGREEDVQAKARAWEAVDAGWDFISRFVK
ncbi:MAG: Type I Iterative PKS [Chrysothrix sp. TS-e1954]|nr:MAG: Type I Iterative PKS [Chrysothrix sp. TS-e1954]